MDFIAEERKLKDGTEIKNESFLNRIRLLKAMGRKPKVQVKPVCCCKPNCKVCGGTGYVHGPYVTVYYSIVDKKRGDKVRTWEYLGPLEPKR